MLDLRLHRLPLEGRRRRIVELYKDGVIDRAEFDREIQIIQNQLKTTAPADVTLAELSIADFERFPDVWDAAIPEERAELLGHMLESLYVNFKTGQALETVPKPGFRCVFEGTEIAEPLTCLANDHQLTIGDPEGIRTPDLQRDKLVC